MRWLGRWRRAGRHPPPKSTNGIVWDKGTLWIAALYGAQLVAVDPASGAITRGYGADDGLVRNDDLVLVDHGAFVLTEPEDGTVSRFDPKRGREVIATVGSNANGIARCDDGRVFVNREINPGGVYEVDPKGVEPPRTVTTDVTTLNAMTCIGNDLFAPLFSLAGGVIRIDRETGATQTIASGMVLPAAVHQTSDGRLVALQSVFPGRLVQVDPASGALTEIARLGSMIPDNFAMAPDGTFYVTDFVNAGVLVIEPGGGTRRIEL